MEKLNSAETAYLDGFMDASSLYPRKNPFPIGSVENWEYDRGYTASLQELDEA